MGGNGWWAAWPAGEEGGVGEEGHEDGVAERKKTCGARSCPPSRVMGVQITMLAGLDYCSGRRSAAAEQCNNIRLQ